MYSASQLDKATTFCFCDCQVIRFSPRKKKDSCGTLSPVYVSTVITVTETSEAHFSSLPLVAAPKVDSPRDVPQYPFDSYKVFDCWFLHES
jgi:hypothetical protein